MSFPDLNPLIILKLKKTCFGGITVNFHLNNIRMGQCFVSCLQLCKLNKLSCVHNFRLSNVLKRK